DPGEGRASRRLLDHRGAGRGAAKAGPAAAPADLPGDHLARELRAGGARRLAPAVRDALHLPHLSRALARRAGGAVQTLRSAVRRARPRSQGGRAHDAGPLLRARGRRPGARDLPAACRVVLQQGDRQPARRRAGAREGLRAHHDRGQAHPRDGLPGVRQARPVQRADRRRSRGLHRQAARAQAPLRHHGVRAVVQHRRHRPGARRARHAADQGDGDPLRVMLAPAGKTDDDGGAAAPGGRSRGVQMSLEGRVAIVTGGAMGIGFAAAEGLAARGAAVVIADRTDAEAAAARLSAAGHRASGLAVDVAAEPDCAAMVARARDAFGGLDILVNNAAIFSTLTPTKFEELDPAEWRRVMDVNVMGLFLGCRAALPAFKARGGGRIVNIASGVAFKGNPYMAHYVASKGAVVSLTRALATELGAHNVLVNAVAPGFTLSDGVLRNPALIAGAQGPSLRTRVLARDMVAADLVGAIAFFAGPD